MKKEEATRDISEISNLIYELNGKRIMIDRDLAKLYGVTVSALNQAVGRNIDRFPPDFSYKINKTDFIDLRSQNVIVNHENLFTRSDQPPTVFTEQGAYALSFILKSPQAITMGIFIIRAFTMMKQAVLGDEMLVKTLLSNVENLSIAFRSREKEVEQHLMVLYRDSQKTKKKVDDMANKIKQILIQINQK